MALPAGSRLGPYEVTALLGAGGMGEVYRAQDTRLGRTVAVKILPAILSGDRAFRQRFDREARTISSLDHPNICAVYDVGEHDGLAYLVMQYLEGETLADRLAQGPLPLVEALRIGGDVLRALAAAHARGIIHRDLKPGNIMLTRVGARLLDFGLAKPATAGVMAGAPTALATSPLPTTPITAQGTILGTCQYMAPEQVEGDEADTRTDLFAFGAVLYEMVTGRGAFTGRTAASVIGSILKEDPAPPSSLAADVPPALDRLIARCLAKDRDERWQTARDLLSELTWIAGQGVATPDAAPTVAAVVPRSSWRRAARIGVPAAVAIAAATLTWFAAGQRRVPQPRIEFSINVPADAPIRRSVGGGVAVSPDGQRIVWVAQPRGSDSSLLYMRRFDTHGAAPIAGTEGGFAPFFSPDGRWVGYFTDDNVMRVPVAGGKPTRIAAKGPFSRASWVAEDAIVLGTTLAAGSGPLHRVAASGGSEPVPITTLAKGERIHQAPRLLPDRRHLLFTVHGENGMQLAVTALGSGTHRLIGLEGSDPRYAEPGAIIFSRENALFEAPFDPSALRVTGPETAILPDARVIPAGQIGMLDFDPSGRLVYVPREGPETQQVVWVDRAGHPAPIVVERSMASRPRISGDGRRFVASVRNPNRVRIVDATGGLPVDLDVPGVDPLWAADETVIFRQRNEAVDTLFRMPANGGAAAEPIFRGADWLELTPEDWTRDGRLLFSSTFRTRGARNRDMFVVRPGGTPLPVLQSPADEAEGRVSPDGAWLAYTATTTGRSRVYVRPFDRTGGVQTVSAEGGHNPVWARDGSALYFQEGNTIQRASVQSLRFAIGAPAAVFSPAATILAYDIAPDGRMLVLLEPPGRVPDELRVVLGWRTSAGATSAR